MAKLKVSALAESFIPGVKRDQPLDQDAGPPESLEEKRQRRRRRRPLRPVQYILLAALGLTVGAGGAAIWIYQELEKGLPDVAEVLTFVRDGTLTIKAANGKILQQRGPATREKLPLQKIPPKLVQAFIAVEDRRFYVHDGVDYQGVVRAIVSNLTAGDVVEGASTVTQQLARMVFLNQERSVWRKLKEAMLSRKIEERISKEQILERYLNLVYLGSGAYGVADAAWVFFGKPVSALTLPEMATIAGMPPAPSDYSPLVNAKAAQERRNVVLARMADEGFITEAEAQAAQATPMLLKPKLPKRLLVEAPYFTTYVQQELTKYVSRDVVEAGGLTIETSLNPKWQTTAEQIVKEAIAQEGPGQGFAQTALVTIDPRTGEIKAMVGGDDFGKSQFNRVTQAQRQPGSTFKTFVYTAAIAAGFSPHDGYADAPFAVDGYQPQNASRKYSGWMSMRDALTRSVNVIAVKVLLDVGFDPVIKMAQGMGIKSKLKPVYSMALGSNEVNLLELTSAYGTLAAQGTHIEVHGIRRILNSRGEVLFDAKKKLKPKRVLDKNSAAIMTWMLRGVVESGTGANAYLEGRAVAGKTGTSEEARDLWFIGYIPQLVTGVWLGNDNNDPTWGASSTAALIWHRFMVKAVAGMPVQKFPVLPPLDGRKGSIKAKPVRGRVTAGKASASQEESTPRSSSAESAPSEPSRRSSRRSADEEQWAPEATTPTRHSSPSNAVEEAPAIKDASTDSAPAVSEPAPTPIESPPSNELPPADPAPAVEPAPSPAPAPAPQSSP